MKEKMKGKKQEVRLKRPSCELILQCTLCYYFTYIMYHVSQDKKREAENDKASADLKRNAEKEKRGAEDEGKRRLRKEVAERKQLNERESIKSRSENDIMTDDEDLMWDVDANAESEVGVHAHHNVF